MAMSLPVTEKTPTNLDSISLLRAKKDQLTKENRIARMKGSANGVGAISTIVLSATVIYQIAKRIFSLFFSREHSVKPLLHKNITVYLGGGTLVFLFAICAKKIFEHFYSNMRAHFEKIKISEEAFEKEKDQTAKGILGL
jgi:hypothetical protein